MGAAVTTMAVKQRRKAGKPGLKIILNISMIFAVIYLSPDIGTGWVFGFPARLSGQAQGLVSLVVGRADAAMASALFFHWAAVSP
jgi:hypothetical protein